MIQIPLHIQMEENMIFFFCGYEKTKTNHIVGPSAWDYYLLHIVHKGKGTVQTNNKEYLIEEGDGFIIYPDVITKYSSDNNDPWEYSWIAIKGIAIDKILYNTNLSPFQNKFSHPNFDFFKHFSIQYQNTLTFDISNILKLKSNLYLFFTQLITANKSIEKQTHIDTKNVYINAVENYINANFQNNITIQQISAYIGLNMSYLGTLFKSKKGVSIKKYLTTIRFQRACELLKNTNYPISDISRSVGYTDQLQFTKIFKKYKYVSPTQYRIENQKKIQ